MLLNLSVNSMNYITNVQNYISSATQVRMAATYAAPHAPMLPSKPVPCKHNSADLFINFKFRQTAYNFNGSASWKGSQCAPGKEWRSRHSPSRDRAPGIRRCCGERRRGP